MSIKRPKNILKFITCYYENYDMNKQHVFI